MLPTVILADVPESVRILTDPTPKHAFYGHHFNIPLAPSATHPRTHYDVRAA